MALGFQSIVSNCKTFEYVARPIFWISIILIFQSNSAFTIGVAADNEWKEWQKLGDPVLHIDLRGKPC